MTNLSNQCPQCDGFGKVSGVGCPGFHLMQFHCDLCDGRGQLTDEQVTWINKGERLRQARLLRQLTKKKEAERRGIHWLTYAYIERGIEYNLDLEE